MSLCNYALKLPSFNSYELKLIAIVTMILDHVGIVFFPQFVLFRLLGRIAFVLFCYLIVEGYIHTRNSKKYLLKLLMWAFISEVPFDLLFQGQWYAPYHQNVFFTLAAGLITIMMLNSKIQTDMKVLFVVVMYTAANYFNLNYLYLGILQIVFFYIFRSNNIRKFISIGILNILFVGRIGIQAAGVLAFLPIYLYNGKRGPKAGNWFYSIYALHLCLFWLIKRFLL